MELHSGIALSETTYVYFSIASLIDREMEMFSEMFLANHWPRAADEEIDRQANRTIEKEKEMREKK